MKEIMRSRTDKNELATTGHVKGMVVNNRSLSKFFLHPHRRRRRITGSIRFGQRRSHVPNTRVFVKRHKSSPSLNDKGIHTNAWIEPNTQFVSGHGAALIEGK